MPFFQFYTTVSENKVPKDFVKKTGLLLSQVLRDKPLETLMVHLMAGQTMFAGSDPNGQEDIAFAVLQSWGSVTPDDNRKTVEELTKHVKRELGINADQFRVVFVDLDPNMIAISGKIVPDLLG